MRRHFPPLTARAPRRQSGIKKRLPPLIQLPTGNWIDPTLVVSITCLPEAAGHFGTPLPPRVTIGMADGGMHLICFSDALDAASCRNHLAVSVNKARRAAR